jgi:microcystin-dependent protein
MGGTAAGRVTSGGSGVDGTTVGAMGGSQLLQIHNHPISDPGHTHTDSGHQHGFTTPTGNPVGEPITGTDVYLPGSGLATTFPKIPLTDVGHANIQSATTGVTIANTGGGSNQNMQPSLVCLYIIYAS